MSGGDTRGDQGVEDVDLIVIGAGPAGANAAIAAAGCGLVALLIDEGSDAGGQVHRPPPPEWTLASHRDAGPDHDAGEALRRRVAAAGVRHLRGHGVWSVTPGFEVRTVSGSGEAAWRSPRLVVAAGATERILPFPGWTTPGVYGVAAATRLLKTDQVLPGRRTLVAGAGPLPYAVAAAIVAGGGEVVAVADLAGTADWLTAMPALLAAPTLAARGFAWRARLARAGVPILARHHVGRVLGGESVEAVELVPVDARGVPQAGAGPVRHAVDAVVVGHGLVPSTEITRLLRAAHVHDAPRGGWHVVRDERWRTSIPGLWVAGDCAGIAGARAAAASGTIAGLAVANDAGRLTDEAFAHRLRELTLAHRRADRVGRRMAAMMALRPGLLDAMTPDTIVCRCEDVERGAIDEALDAGAGDCNELKAWTRCGMGPCQGRTCGEAAAELVAARTGGREAAGHWTARVPLRPQRIGALAPACPYDEIWQSPAGRIATAILPAENTAGRPAAESPGQPVSAAPDRPGRHR
jgi:thioredoxin reductase